MIILFVTIATLFLIIWLAGYAYQTDFSIPTTNFDKTKKVLAIFPHPDDEVLTVGGLLRGSTSTLYLLTKGEKGTNNGKPDPNLGSIRSAEAIRAKTILGIDKLIHDDFGDGNLESNKSKFAKKIEQVISNEKPHYIVTYDLSGLYGHPDHIVCARVVTELVDEKFPSIRLLYATQPPKVLKTLSLPLHMAKDKNYLSKRTTPTIKNFIGLSIFPKIQALYAYKSQYHSFRSSFPLKFIPLWFLISTSLYEYFYEAN